MSTFDTDYEDDDEEAQASQKMATVPRDKVRKWEKQEREAAEALTRAETAERKLAIFQAGLVDLSPKQMKAIEAAHEGEWTADALAQTASEIGIGSKPSTPAPDVPQAELAAHQQMSQVNAGGAAPIEPSLVEEIQRIPFDPSSPNAAERQLYDLLRSKVGSIPAPEQFVQFPGNSGAVGSGA